MSDPERILEVKDGLHFCHLLAETPQIIAENAFLEKFLDSCYNATAGCNCKRKNNVQKLESDFTLLFSKLKENQRAVISDIFGDTYSSVYLKLSKNEKVKLK